MIFSLVCATINRQKEVEEMLESLNKQSYKSFEVIIVDQNKDDRLVPIVNKYIDILSIKHVKSDILGASHNRNIGIKMATGDVIGFPDDDCVYETDTLLKVKNFFDFNENYYFYACNTKDFSGKHLRYSVSEDNITTRNFYRKGIEFTVFIKLNPQRYYFDENFGIGQKYGNCEISEMILNMLSTGQKGKYFGNDFILHPYKNQSYSYDLTFRYGVGFGAMYKKAIVNYGQKNLIFQFVYYLMRNFIAIIVTKNKKYYIASLKGKMKGFNTYKED